MSDLYTETTRTGYGSRLKRSITGVFFGILLIIGAIVLLWHNEQRTIDRQETLNQAGSEVISIIAGEISSKYNGKLIHTSGEAVGNSELIDEQFGVVSSELKLKRKVEMYQWQEKSHSESVDKLGGSETTTTTYSYDKVWSEYPIDSSSFKKSLEHENTSLWQVYREEWEQNNIHIEEVALTAAFIAQIDTYRGVSLDMMETLSIESGTGVFVSSSGIYYGDNPSTPKIGDLKVSFEEIPRAQVSVMGQYSNGKLIVYTMEKGSISILDYGTHSAEEMIEIEEKSNKLLTWILRLLGIILLYAGANMILGPLVMLAKVVPFISSIIGFGTGLISFVFALIVGPLVIAIAWMYARPMVSVVVILLAASVIWGVIHMRKKKEVSQK